MNTKRKKVVILGATSAIASHVARLLAADGCDFFLAGHDERKLEPIAKDLLARGAGSAVWEALDLTEPGKAAGLAQRAIVALGQVDLVLVAYGTLGNQSRSQEDGAVARRELETNFTSIVEHLTPLANHMEQRGAGCLAVISSVAGDRGRASNYVYGSAKGGLTIFLEGLRSRLARKKVQVLTIKPGFVDTPMTAHLEKSGPLWAKPDQVAADIVKAVRGGKEVLYTPWFWRLIMLIIRSLPAFVMKRINF